MSAEKRRSQTAATENVVTLFCNHQQAASADPNGDAFSLLYPVQSAKALVEHRLGPFAPAELALGLDLPVRLPQAVRGLVERQVWRNRRMAARVQVGLEKHFGGVIQRADRATG